MYLTMGRGRTIGSCITCGRDFVGMRNKRYCSDRCKKIAWIQRSLFKRSESDRRSRSTTHGTCMTCGSAFVGMRDRRYCSARCAERARRPLRRDYDREKARRYRARFPERVKAYRVAHRQQQADSERRWRRANPERVRATQRRFRDKDREHYRQLLRDWDRRNRGKRRAMNAAWRKAHPDRNAHVSAKRRALELAAPGSHTYEQWVALLEEWGNCCAYCGASGVPLERDHVVPLALGGSHDIDNILPACRACNSRKRLMTRDDFLGLLLRDKLEPPTA
ncbi:MAG: HNH endonuclease [Candidatus Limnocylindria bacterium]